MRPTVLLLLALTACKGDNGFVTYDNPPAATITSPAEGSTFDQGLLVELVGRISDDGDSLEVIWTSDRDGELARETTDLDEVTFATAALSVGLHAIELRVVDAAAQGTSATVLLEVVEVAEGPQIAVVRPLAGERGREGVPFVVSAQVADAQDPASALRMHVDSDLDGSLCASVVPDLLGVASCAVTPSAGIHTLTFLVVDSDGFDAEAAALLEITSSDDVDDDGDGFTENQGDCNDSNGTINPLAPELYNGVDDDCDGVIDDGTAGVDDDGDGSSELDGDCDDDDALIHPDAVEFADGVDNDCDGQIDNGTDTFDDDGDGFSEATGDCNDNNPNISPNAADVPYNGLDEDCDGTDRVDVDGDGFAAELVGGDDCDDSDADVNPGATETPYNGDDEDCSGDDLTDVDGDGFDALVVFGGSDCDDQAANVNPGAPEIPYNGLDEDCQGGDLLDGDGDGQNSAAFGGLDCNDTDASIFRGAPEVAYDGIDQDCQNGDLVDVDGDTFAGGVGGPDCNDANPNVNPGSTEVPYNGLDDDCSGTDLTDVDGDGFAGPSASGADCNDGNPAINPGATEVPYNGLDEDCASGDLRDVDGDGFESTSIGGSDCNDTNGAVNPTATETCDGIDNNCGFGADEIGAQGCTLRYGDADNDGYGNANTAACTCASTSTYEVTNDDDCYDLNGDARPGQSGYFAQHRGDFSYDYNCDQAQSKLYPSTAIGACNCTGTFLGACTGCGGNDGWQSSVPSCGQTRTWLAGCNYDISDLFDVCDHRGSGTEQRIQTCR